MRRWLAILLLFCLPLQFSWAAMARYCGHEAGTAAHHIGHHEHVGHSHAKHDGGPHPDATPEAAMGSGLSDLDCGHCHGYCAGMLEVAIAFVAQDHAGRPTAPRTTPAAEHVPARPDRPQWARLA
jgi:hypothetical protein